MKERPILFSGPMVRALLAGAKTQTRRIVKPAPVYITPFIGRDGSPTHEFGLHMHNDARVRFAHAQRSRNRETRSLPVRRARRSAVEGIRKMEPADLTHDDGTPIVYSQFVADDTWTKADAWPWKRDALPGMFMPRGLSRITLDVTEVRVERLHAITGGDVLSEGVDNGKSNPAQGARWENMQRLAFETLWSSINGADSWAANPWVWVVSFRRVEEASRV